MKYFKNGFFLIASLHKEAHAIVCTIGTRKKNTCTDLFYTYLNKGHFLTENGSYVYKESDLYQYELYLKKNMPTFIKELGYIGGVITNDKNSKKHLKWLIETNLLMDVRTKEEMKVIFCKLSMLCSSSVSFYYL